jgi:hypothetical protein
MSMSTVAVTTTSLAVSPRPLMNPRAPQAAAPLLKGSNQTVTATSTAAAAAAAAKKPAKEMTRAERRELQVF